MGSGTKDVDAKIFVSGIKSPRFYINGVNYTKNLMTSHIRVAHKEIGFFEAGLIALSAADLTNVAKGKTFTLWLNAKVPFVGIIENADPAEDYTFKISGNGKIEYMLYNLGVNPTASTTSGSGYGRPQYDSKSAKTITEEQMVGSGVTLVTDGAFTYPPITIRADFDNKLSFENGCADLANVIWYVKYGSVVKSGAGYDSTLALTTPTYYFVPDTYLLTTPTVGIYVRTKKGGWAMSNFVNATGMSNKVDLEQTWNSIYALGYGDGINQLWSRMFDSTNNRTYLTADLTATGTSATVFDGSVLPANGYVWIGVERCAFTRVTNTLTLTRATADGTVTIGGVSYAYKKGYAHRKGIYVQDTQYGESNFEAGSNCSIELNGLKQHTIEDKRLIDQDSLDWMCQRVFDNHNTPPGRILVTASDINNGFLEDFEIYKRYSLYDTVSGTDGDYILYSKEYFYDYGQFSANYEFSNVTYELMKILREVKQTQENITKYMQGSTNIYQVSQAENCDATHPLEMKFFIPGDTVALNKIKLNFKIAAYRAYETTTSSTNTTNQDLTGYSMANWYSLSLPYVMSRIKTINGATSIMWVDPNDFTYSGNMIQTDGSWTSMTGTQSYIASAICSDSCGREMSSWYAGLGRMFGTAGTLSGVTCVTGAGITSQSFVSSGDYSSNSWTWANTPNYTTAIIPAQQTGSFNKIVVIFYLVNETNQTRTWTWKLRLGSTSGTIIDSGTWNATPFVHTTLTSTFTTESYVGQALYLCIDGNLFNSTTMVDASYFMMQIYTLGTQTTSHNHALTFGIYEEAYTSPSIQVHTKKEGGAYSLVGTYTTDQSNLDITTMFDGTKDTWYYVKFTPNKNLRIEANTFVQLFINSR